MSAVAKRIRTDRAALREAQRRWGKGGAVERHPHVPKDGLPYYRDPETKRTVHEPPTPAAKPFHRSHRCQVGRIALGLFFEIKGEGPTWDEAFAAADRSEAADRERMRKLREEAEAESAARRGSR